MPTIRWPSTQRTNPMPCPACGECGWWGIQNPPHTCGKFADVAPQDAPAQTTLPCPHGRPSWAMCPHCNGFAFAKPEVTAGWKCPGCGQCFGPQVPKCDTCAQKSIASVSIAQATDDGSCTYCGLPANSADCQRAHP